MKAPRLRVEEISRKVDDRTLWSELSFEVESKQCLVLKGPSGSGKTLLLRTLVGLEQLESGRIECFGEELGRADIPRMRARMMLVPQSSHLTGRTIEDVLMAPFDLEIHASRSYDRTEAERLVSGFGRDRNFFSAEVDDLSGGERQIAALVRALLLEPDILLLDEPTAHLDSTTREAVEIRIGKWVDAGGSAIWTTHSADQADRVRRGGSINLSDADAGADAATTTNR